MAESTLRAATSDTATSARGLTWPMAWRNLWRNRRRTWLTTGGIAFATLLVTMSMALQAGSYQSMIDNATGLFMGYAQISRSDYIKDSKLEQTVANAIQQSGGPIRPEDLTAPLTEYQNALTRARYIRNRFRGSLFGSEESVPSVAAA